LSDNRYLINSVLRATQILESFSVEKPAYTNSEFAKKLGLNKSTITRLLYSLERAGFLVKDPKTKEYRLTHRLFRIGNVYISQIDLHKESMELLEQLSASCKETVHLGILNEFNVIYLNKIEGPQAIAMISRIGRTNPAYCTALGKAMLAFLPEERLENFFRTVELKRYTPNTICDPDALRCELRRIKEKRYAIDDREHEHDVKCVGAPIRDKDGNVIAAISIAGPAFRMIRSKIEEEFVPAVTTTAAQISSRLGYLGGN
jgi:IclR family KDG regulon transcriptional repressor